MWWVAPTASAAPRVVDHDVGVGARPRSRPCAGTGRTSGPAWSRQVSTQRGSVISPATTPWCSRSIRCSTPGIPFGILEKSPRPSSFCSLKQNGQWSVDTTDRSLVRRPRHSESWCSLGAAAARRRTWRPRSPAGPGRPGTGTGTAGRSRRTRSARRPGLGDRRQRLRGRQVHDVQRAVGHLGQRDRPVSRLALQLGRPGQAVVTGSVWPAARPARRAGRWRCRSPRAS
jgi:hypothetical protein